MRLLRIRDYCEYEIIANTRLLQIRDIAITRLLRIRDYCEYEIIPIVFDNCTFLLLLMSTCPLVIDQSLVLGSNRSILTPLWYFRPSILYIYSDFVWPSSFEVDQSKLQNNGILQSDVQQRKLGTAN